MWQRVGDGQEWSSEALKIPRTVYIQPLHLSSSSLRDGDLLCGKIPSWVSACEREEAREAGAPSTDSFPSRDWCLLGQILGKGQIASDRA